MYSNFPLYIFVEKNFIAYFFYLSETYFKYIDKYMHTVKIVTRSTLNCSLWRKYFIILDNLQMSYFKFHHIEIKCWKVKNVLSLAILLCCCFDSYKIQLVLFCVVFIVAPLSVFILKQCHRHPQMEIQRLT